MPRLTGQEEVGVRVSEVRRGAWRGTRLSSGGWVLAIVVSSVFLATFQFFDR